MEDEQSENGLNGFKSAVKIIPIDKDFGKLIDEHQLLCKDLLKRAEASLEWMVKVLKWQHDDCGISPGNYSDELTEAAAVLEALKEVNSET